FRGNPALIRIQRKARLIRLNLARRIVTLAMSDSFRAACKSHPTIRSILCVSVNSVSLCLNCVHNANAHLDPDTQSSLRHREELLLQAALKRIGHLKFAISDLK